MVELTEQFMGKKIALETDQIYESQIRENDSKFQ